jgi:HD-like signal output (HDOD) protein
MPYPGFNDTILKAFLQRYPDEIRINSLKINIHELMAALADEDMDIKKLAEVLYRYPMICARLIRLANSAWASPVKPITSIESACLQLGSSLIKSVSIALAVSSSFNLVRCPAFNPTRFWATSLLVADAAELIFKSLPTRIDSHPDTQQILRTSGMLHNIGLLWLADNFAQETDQLLKFANADQSISVKATFQESLGVDYCAVGAWIAQQWKLPAELVNIIAYHRDLAQLDDAPPPIRITGAAARMVSILFHQADWETDEDLSDMGAHADSQRQNYTLLAKKFDPTLELAKTLLAYK